LSLFTLVFLFLVLFCFLVFSSSRLLVLYVSYELSLAPIIFIIIVWGSYPERSLGSTILLLYTTVFSIPFMGVIFYYYLKIGRFSFFSMEFCYLTSSSCIPILYSFIVSLVFMVKLPVFGLHYWLPIAHVEAPTFGSMVLAGVLLKLGGVGLIRCFVLRNWSTLSFYSTSFFFFFLVFTPLVCCFQSDLKRLVAYSSVSHIIVSPILFCFYSSLRAKAVIFCFFIHGFSSPLLFSLVGFIYSFSGSRQLIFVHGLVFLRPLFSFLMSMAFFLRCVFLLFLLL